ncbi:MAG TPA: hypothetical protein VFM18_18455 [Methanosarcina sp.]|nr:hypothetical protein [Methanosarcina sp.]
MRHTVEIEYSNLSLKEIEHQKYDQRAWCLECIGKRGKDWAVTLKQYNVSIFVFDQESHAALFALKWK